MNEPCSPEVLWTNAVVWRQEERSTKSGDFMNHQRSPGNLWTINIIRIFYERSTLSGDVINKRRNSETQSTVDVVQRLFEWSTLYYTYKIICITTAQLVTVPSIAVIKLVQSPNNSAACLPAQPYQKKPVTVKIWCDVHTAKRWLRFGKQP